MRLPSLLAAVGLIAVGLVATSPSATAAGTCSLYAPSRISIGQPYRAITIKQGPNCAAAGVVDAAWAGYHPTQGLQEFLYFENSARSEVIDVYDFATPLGRLSWRPEGAYDADFNAVYQYPASTDVRLSSYGRVTATRSGTRVNVRTSAMRYWQGGSKFIGWSGARGQIQYRVPGTTTWQPLKEVYSSSAGTYSYTYNVSATRDYRVILRAVSTIWESTSPAVRR